MTLDEAVALRSADAIDQIDLEARAAALSAIASAMQIFESSPLSVAEREAILREHFAAGRAELNGYIPEEADSAWHRAVQRALGELDGL